MIEVFSVAKSKYSPFNKAARAAVFLIAALSGCATEDNELGEDVSVAIADSKGEAGVDLGVTEQALNPGQSGWLAWYTDGYLYNALAIDSCDDDSQVRLDENGDVSYRPASAGNFSIVGNAWAAADIVCDKLDRVFAFNRDRTIWVANVTQQPLTFTRVGRPWAAKQIEFALGYLWAYNDDNTLWKSRSGADGSWTQVATIAKGLRMAGNSTKIFLLNAQGYIQSGSGPNNTWTQIGYARGVRDIFGRPGDCCSNDVKNNMAALMAPDMNGFSEVFWGAPLSSWSGFTNPPQFRPPTSMPPNNPNTMIDFECYCGGYHLDNNALWVEPRTYAARGCLSKEGNVGFTTGSQCGMVCTKLRLHDLAAVPYISPYNIPMPGTQCKQDGSNLPYPL